jgi:ribosomal protein L22
MKHLTVPKINYALFTKEEQIELRLFAKTIQVLEDGYGVCDESEMKSCAACQATYVMRNLVGQMELVICFRQNKKNNMKKVVKAAKAPAKKVTKVVKKVAKK